MGRSIRENDEKKNQPENIRTWGGPVIPKGAYKYNDFKN